MHFTKPCFTIDLARLRAWARLALCWTWSLLTGAAFNPRHMRTRGAITLDQIARFVAELIVVAAMRAARLHARPKPWGNPFPIVGFRQKWLRPTARRAIGARLRAQLRHRDPLVRIIILLHALVHFDAYVARMTPRMIRRLSRLEPRIVVAPPADAVITLAVHTPRAADSS